MNNIVLTAAPEDKIFAKRLSIELGAEFVSLETSTFSNGEQNVQVDKNINGKIVVLVRQTFFPENDGIMQLALAMNAIRQCQPSLFLLILPYFPYSRQDKTTPGKALGVQVVGQILQLAKPDALFSMDLHSQNILDYCNFPFVHLAADSLFATDIQQRFVLEDIVLISPDAGGTQRTKEIADILKVPYFSLDKQRLDSGMIKMELCAEKIERKNKKIHIFIDDIIDTGKTLLKAIDVCAFAAGSEPLEKHIYATHGIFSCPASFEKLYQCCDSITVTDTFNHHLLPDKFNKLKILSCRHEFLKAIKMLLAQITMDKYI